MYRRDFLLSTSGLLLAPVVALAKQASTAGTNEMPMAGKPFPAFQELDAQICEFLTANHIAGSAIAVLYRDNLIYSRAYGLRDQENHHPFLPTTVCSIGSVSKPVTSLAMLTLIKSAKVRLEDPVVNILLKTGEFHRSDFADARLERVTVRQLLQQTSGFGKDHEVWINKWLAEQMHVQRVTLTDAIKMAFKQPLTRDPGDYYVYCNTNFMVLNKLVEVLSGATYEKYVQTEVFKPIGILSARIVPSTRDAVKPDEAVMYDYPDRKLPSFIPADKGRPTSISYGGLDYRSAGMWSMSVIDLAKLYRAIAFRGHPNVGPSLMREIVSEPKDARGEWPREDLKKNYYGLGWNCFTSPNTGAVTIEHLGELSGSFAGVSMRDDQYAVCFVSNTSDGNYNFAVKLLTILHQGLNEMIRRHLRFPASDLFDAS